MGTSNFTLRYAGITELMKSPELKAAMDEQARHVAELAKTIAPVETGNYVDHIDSGTFDDTDRTTGYVSVDVPYATTVEVRDRVLGKALDAAGL